MCLYSIRTHANEEPRVRSEHSARRWSLIEVDEGGARIGPEFNAEMMFLACSKTSPWQGCAGKLIFATCNHFFELYLTLASILFFCRIFLIFRVKKAIPWKLSKSRIIPRNSFFLTYKFFYFFNKLICDFRMNNTANMTQKSNSNIATFIN